MRKARGKIKADLFRELEALASECDLDLEGLLQKMKDEDFARGIRAVLRGEAVIQESSSVSDISLDAAVRASGYLIPYND